jgi:hypothetical protein
VPSLRRISSSLAINLLPINLNPCSIARCMCSLGSHGVVRVVYRYAYASTSAASGVFGMMLPRLSTDKKDESRFLLSEYSRLSTCEPCLLCVLLFVCDALLRASWMALLAALTDSRLLLISLLSFSSCFDCLPIVR